MTGEDAMETGGGYLTPTEFARALGLSRGETVREWCVLGKVPGAFRVNDCPKSRWRIPRESVGEYVRQRQAQGGAVKENRQPGDADTPAERGRVCNEIMRVYRGNEYRAVRERLVEDIVKRRKTVAEVRDELEKERKRREAQSPKSKAQSG